MARHFTAASSEKVTLSLGAVGFAFGPGTIAAIVRRSSTNALGGIVRVGNGATTNFYGLEWSNTGGILLICENAAGLPAVGIIAVGDWVLFVMTKANGTVAPRQHIIRFDGSAPTHTDSGGTLVNSLVPATNVTLGANVRSTANFDNGDIALVAIWNVVLTDTQVESLGTDPSYQNWSANVVPRAYWRPNSNPAVTVVDATGNGSNETSHTGTSASVGEFPLFNASVPTRPARPSGLLGYGTPRRLGREREIEQLFRAIVSVPASSSTSDAGTSSLAIVAGTFTDEIADAGSSASTIATAGAAKITDAGASSFVLATVKTREAIGDTASTLVILADGPRTDTIRDAGTSSFALVTTGTEKVTDTGTSTLVVATVKTLEAIADAGASSFTIATAGSGGPGDTGASTTTLVTATVSEAIADAGATLVILLASGTNDEVDAGTSTLAIVGTSAEELVDQGSSDVVLVTGAALEAVADAGSSTLVLVTSGVEGIAFADSGESDFALVTSGVEAFADAATSPLVIDAVSAGEAIADAGASDVILLTFGADSNSGTSTLTLVTGGIEGSQSGTSTFTLVTSGSELVEVIEAGTSIVILQTGGTFTPSMRGASVVRLVTGGSEPVQAGSSPFRLVTGGTGYVSEPIQSGESAFVISTRGVGVVVGPGIITTEEDCCISLVEPVPTPYRN